jgi:hypothetical protein
MPLSKEQWAAATRALPILYKMLEEKNSKLAETDGNRFRLAEKLADTPNVPFDSQKIAALLYSIVLEDVNGVINGVPGSGQLFWQVKPPKLVAWEQSRIPQRPTHLPEKKERRVSSESSSERIENIQALERLYDGLGYVSPRSAPLRNFINDFQENPTFDSREGLKAAKRFLSEKDPRIAVQNLQRHLAAERDGSEYPNWNRLQTASGVHDVSEFLS